MMLAGFLSGPSHQQPAKPGSLLTDSQRMQVYFFVLDQVLQQRAQPVAKSSTDLGELCSRQTPSWAFHATSCHICVSSTSTWLRLAVIEDAVQGLHLRVVPVEAAALRLVHPHVDLDPAEVQAQPAGVGADVVPRLGEIQRRIAAKAAPPAGAVIAA